MSTRYQRGSLRREIRAGGNEVWVWPYRIRGLKPAAAKLTQPKIGWHTFGHSYKSWIGNTNATLRQ
jgi:hypothetical protein